MNRRERRLRIAAIRKTESMRIRAFENDDIDYTTNELNRALAKNGLKELSSPLSYEAAFHKARHSQLGVSKKKRIESQEWLVEHGIKDLLGRTVNIGDPLPDFDDYMRALHQAETAVPPEHLRKAKQ